MKKVVIIASSRSKASKVFSITNRLVDRDEDVDYVVIDPILFRFHASMFDHTENINDRLKAQRVIDDSRVIKEHLITANLLVVVSPVCNGTIHGDLKNLLSKMSEWIRLFKLAQKPVILATTSEIDDADIVLDSLERTFCGLGASVVLKSDFTNHDNHEVSSDKIDVVKSTMNEVLSIESMAFKPSQTQEILYETYKEIISSYPMDHDEYIYWKDSGLLACSSLSEYFDSLIHECYF